VVGVIVEVRFPLVDDPGARAQPEPRSAPRAADKLTRSADGNAVRLRNPDNQRPGGPFGGSRPRATCPVQDKSTWSTPQGFPSAAVAYLCRGRKCLAVRQSPEMSGMETALGSPGCRNRTSAFARAAGGRPAGALLRRRLRRATTRGFQTGRRGPAGSTCAPFYGVFGARARRRAGACLRRPRRPDRPRRWPVHD